MRVSFTNSISSAYKVLKDITLILALKSHQRLPNEVFPIVQYMEKLLGSFSLGGRTFPLLSCLSILPNSFFDLAHLSKTSPHWVYF